MPMWPIRNVMTIDVITASDDTPVAEVAAILGEQGIGAVPIVNRFDVVVGVLSWTDLHRTIDRADRDDDAARGRLGPDRPADVRWPDQAAIHLMSAPPVTVEPDASLPAAGRLMHHHNIGRLLVTDPNQRLLGIVTRRDLLRVHARLDAVIRDEVSRRVLRRMLMIERDSVQVTVDDGVVTLTGRTGHKSTALVAVGLTEAVAGVTRVVDRLSFDTDDTVVEQAPRTSAHDPMDGWWVGRSPEDEGPSPAADEIGHRAGTNPAATPSAPQGPGSATGEDPGRPNPEMRMPRSGTTAGTARIAGDIVDEWGRQSFPASDPPMNW